MSIRVAVLLDGERIAARLHLLERDVQVKGIFCILACVGLEGDVYVLIFVVRKRDVLGAGGAVAFEGEVIVLAGEQLGVADDLPVFAIHLLDGEGGTFEGVKTPVAADGASDGEIATGVGRSDELIALVPGA